jgi:RNA methyltransferase, TrmH family
MKSITSRQNPWVKRLRDAIRDHDDEIVIEGPKPVIDAIAAGWKPIAVVTREREWDAGVPTGADLIAFSPHLFDAIAETKTPQNVIALFERPRTSLARVLKSPELIVALDGVQDPGNVGTIVRLAAAFDCAGVALLPGSADALSPKAIRASAGTVLSIPIVNTTVDDLVATKRPIYAADASGRADDPPASRAILVFGNEGSGVSEEIRRVATPIAIAMSQRVESLNVAASAAILLSRSYQQRRV